MMFPEISASPDPLAEDSSPPVDSSAAELCVSDEVSLVVVPLLQDANSEQDKARARIRESAFFIFIFLLFDMENFAIILSTLSLQCR